MFHLTPQERQVVLFLAAAALIGSGLNLLKTNGPGKKATIFLFEDLGKINLNTADKELLMSIKGIGTKLAERIITCRQINGPFKDLQDLKSIKGITAYRYEMIKQDLIVK